MRLSDTRRQHLSYICRQRRRTLARTGASTGRTASRKQWPDSAVYLKNTMTAIYMIIPCHIPAYRNPRVPCRTKRKTGCGIQQIPVCHIASCCPLFPAHAFYGRSRNATPHPGWPDPSIVFTYSPTTPPQKPIRAFYDGRQRSGTWNQQGVPAWSRSV